MDKRRRPVQYGHRRHRHPQGRPGLREALFSLSMMEKELVPEDQRANFIETLDAVMLDYESAV